MNIQPLAILDFFINTDNWNIILFLLLICSLIAVTIFIERIIFFRQAEIDINQFLIKLRAHVKDDNLVEAIKLCDKTDGPVSSIIKVGLCRISRSQSEIEHAMEIAGLIEISKLERNCKILSIVAHIAPLIGLLGTVFGFIQAFGEMRLSGLVDISTSRIGEAMEYALITTAAGLVVAIPCIIAYNYLVSRIETFILQIQTTSSEVVDFLRTRDEI